VQTVYDVREKGAVWLPREAIEALEVKAGMMVGATPIAAFERAKPEKLTAAAPSTNGRKSAASDRAKAAAKSAAKRGSKR